MGDFEGLVAVVTGGASGIGLATALALAGRGARVAVFDVKPDVPVPLEGFLVDVADRRGVETAVAAVGERFGRIDVLINAAGIAASGTVVDNGEDEWARVLSVNVTGVARVSAAALPWLRASPVAAIVNTSSIAAQTGLPDRAVYSASKGAVLALTRAMAADHRRDGIRVNCACLGTAATPWVDGLLTAPDDRVAEWDALGARQAIGRLVTVEVAQDICYLASPLSGPTTGSVLDVAGGATELRVRPLPV